MLVCQDFVNLMFKPIRTIVETIVKLATSAFRRVHCVLVLSFLSGPLLNRSEKPECKSFFNRKKVSVNDHEDGRATAF